MKRTRVFDTGFMHVESVEGIKPYTEHVVGTKGSQFSVGVLIDSDEADMVFVVSQQRSAMITEENPTGEIEEVVAGRCDKENEAILAVIKREVQEEFGEDIDDEQIVIINPDNPLAMSPGILKERMYLAYVKLRDSSVVRVGQIFGLAEEGERTKIVGIAKDKLEEYQAQDMKTFALIQWYLLRQAKAKVDTYNTLAELREKYKSPGVYVPEGHENMM